MRFLQALFALRHEMARSLPDIFLRRTGMGTLGDPGARTIAAIGTIAARELGWPGKKLTEETETLKRLVAVPR